MTDPFAMEALTGIPQGDPKKRKKPDPGAAIDSAAAILTNRARARADSALGTGHDGAVSQAIAGRQLRDAESEYQSAASLRAQAQKARTPTPTKGKTP